MTHEHISDEQARQIARAQLRAELEAGGASPDLMAAFGFDVPGPRPGSYRSRRRARRVAERRQRR
ncbi:MAG: hypothetical protein ACLQDY_08375 [Streptosporangiaceae bacterium]